MKMKTTSNHSLLTAGLALFAVTVFALGAPRPASAFGFDDSWMPFDTSPPAERGATKSKQYGVLIRNKVPLLSKAGLEYLSQAVARYDNIVAGGGWKKIPGGELLLLGSVSPRVTALRQRLKKTGDLKQRYGFTNTYDSFVFEAVKKFQTRHGLRPNGRVNKPTLAALNISAEHRLAQVRLNQQRLSKHLSEGLAERYVMVNIAASQLEAVEGGVISQTQRVIVGKPEFQTPVMKAKIIELNFYPYWHVPDSIARRDIFPQLVKGGNYLEKTRTRVLEKWGGKQLDPAVIDWQSPQARKYKFRQDPGKDNALGVLRINMPNSEAVYLHDTPMKRLFGSNVRAYSAGCVRVQNIDKLAAWLLKSNAGWGLSRIKETIREGNSKNVGLKRRTPVYFSYFTAWASGDGNVQFRSDIYHRDKLGGGAKLVIKNSQLPRNNGNGSVSAPRG